jgi:hypothetical protein
MTAEEATIEAYTTPIGFIEGVLGEPLYGWQDKALAPLELATGKNAKRVNIAAITPNGAGKDTKLICGATHYWLGVFPKGRVVVTSKSDLQITEQTIPAIESHKGKFSGYQSVFSPRYELSTPTGGKCICFVTNKGERAEGWHKEDDFRGPLLLIINEGKSVDQAIYDSLLGRCTPNAVMVVSSPGPKVGPLWDIVTKNRENWIVIQAGLKDCPHIPQERIQFVLDTYGENHPITRSTIYGEFMDQEDADEFIVNATALESLITNPPKFRPGIRVGFCDFGGGRSEHTFGVRDGNKLEIRDAWIEANPEAAAGRFIRAFRESGLKQEDIWCDASDKNLAELLSSMGWTINRQNFGAPSMNDQYKSWGAEAWWETGIAILKGEFIIPDDKKLIAQLTTRKKTITPTGKLGVEEKHDLAKRNLPSPDRGDTVCGLIRIAGNALPTKQAFSIPGDWMKQVENNEQYAVVEEMGAFAGV